MLLCSARIAVEENIDPLRDPAGRLVGAISCLHEVTQERASASATAAGGTAQQAQNLLETLPLAVYTTDAAGLITFYNQAAANLWGCRPELGKSVFCGSWKLYRPDGRPLPHDECPMALTLKERRAVRDSEAIADKLIVTARTSGGQRDAEFDDFLFDRIKPARRGVEVFQKAIAMAERVFKRIRARAVPLVDRQNQPIKKAAAITCRAAEQAILIRCQPQKGEMIEKAIGGRNRLAVNPALALGLTRRKRGREQNLAGRACHLGEDRIAARTAAPWQADALRTPQPAPRREQRDRFENIGLAGAVRATKRHQSGIAAKVKRRVGSKIREPQPGDARLRLGCRHGQTRIGIST